MKVVKLEPRPKVGGEIYDWEQNNDFQEQPKQWHDNRLLLWLFCIGLAVLLSINF